MPDVIERLLVTMESGGRGVAVLRLNQPEKLNALDGATLEALSNLFAQIEEDANIRAVVITGNGSAFSAGGDLKELLDIGADPLWQPRMRALMNAAAELVLQMRCLSKPIIAAVNGAAVGGGMGLAMAADMRLCASTAYFSTAFIALDLVGFEMGMSVLLPRAIGSSAALQLALSARRVDACQAENLTLVNEVCAPDQLLDRANQIAGEIAVRSARAVRLTKEMMVNQLPLEELRRALHAEMDAQMQCLFTEENRAAIGRLLAGKLAAAAK